MTGGVIVPFAPAGKPDPDKVRAFYIPKGMGISCKPARMALGSEYTG